MLQPHVDDAIATFRVVIILKKDDNSTRLYTKYTPGFLATSGISAK